MLKFLLSSFTFHTCENILEHYFELFIRYMITSISFCCFLDLFSTSFGTYSHFAHLVCVCVSFYELGKTARFPELEEMIMCIVILCVDCF